MTVLFLPALIAVAFSYFAMRYNFVLLNFIGAVGWILLFLAVKEHPPVGVAEGSSTHTALILICIACACAIGLMGLFRQVNRQKDYGKGLSIGESSWKLRISKMVDPVERERQSRMERIEKHRIRMRSASRGRRIR